ncbi:hypothetical protein GCM10023321_43790 [Pseudonocardia eucalypti]|uniref:Uncharacterized protein n=1 Tax=Pseudonocardia eucalypti TaxID=648755 RepID=A0ABP9QEL9_9PSEU|nr:flagellar hook-basal body complex protein FliE [Pseudonocardia eucalypti]MBB6378124.1 flagellar hook-basal body complex protein FliE [Pseudonocardia eucalypti]
MATALSTVAAAKMNLRPVNQRALRKYQEFWKSLVLLDVAMGDIEKLINEAADHKATVASYRIPDAEELMKAAKKAGRSLQIMVTASKKWEAELVSREWK